jgi:hypothetical protein
MTGITSLKALSQTSLLSANRRVQILCCLWATCSCDFYKYSGKNILCALTLRTYTGCQWYYSVLGTHHFICLMLFCSPEQWNEV